LEESISRYLTELDRADPDPELVPAVRVDHLKQKLATVKAQMLQHNAVGEQMRAALDGQLSLTDPDVRSMATNGRGTGMVGYNVQLAVDAKHHLIITHEFTNVGHDRTQFYRMAQLTCDALEAGSLTVAADRGYFKGEEIVACERNGIATLVPKPQTSNNKAKGHFDKKDFRYIPRDDEYQCPAGERAIRRMTRVEDTQTLSLFSSSCSTPLFRTTTKSRSIRIGRRL
jgi:hypothetical protein